MHYSLSLLLSVATLLMIEGCGGRASPPASFSYGTHAPLDKAYQRVVVQPGESLAFIARKYGVDEEAITSLNNLPEGTVLRVGQEIYLPKGSRLKRPSKKIAQLKAKPRATTIEATPLEPLEPIEALAPKVSSEDAWEDVRVDAPMGASKSDASKGDTKIKSTPEKEIFSAAKDTSAKEEKGDDFLDAYREESLEAELESLKKKELQQKSAPESKKAQPEKPLKESTEKTLQMPKTVAPFDPSVEDDNAASEVKVADVKQEAVTTPKVTSSETLVSPKLTGTLISPKEHAPNSDVAESPAKGEDAQNAPNDPDVSAVSVVDPTQFAWPLPFNGDVTLSFNQMVNGAKNDGINITVPRGTPITAIADGVIAHASPVKGFGNLVLIKHNEVWMSAYGHLDKVLVKQGSKIKRGTKIGTVGQTGYVKTPQLHFELRQSSKPVDPMKVIKKP